MDKSREADAKLGMSGEAEWATLLVICGIPDCCAVTRDKYVHEIAKPAVVFLGSASLQERRVGISKKLLEVSLEPGSCLRRWP